MADLYKRLPSNQENQTNVTMVKINRMTNICILEAPSIKKSLNQY